MPEPLETMKVIDKESGDEVVINACDYDPEKHTAVEEDEPEAESEADADAPAGV